MFQLSPVSIDEAIKVMKLVSTAISRNIVITQVDEYEVAVKTSVKTILVTTIYGMYTFFVNRFP